MNPSNAILLGAVTCAFGAYMFGYGGADREAQLVEMTRISVGADTPDTSSKTVAAGAQPTAWSAVVPADSAGSATPGARAPADRRTKYQLTHDLQTELRRLGCYKGELTGEWNGRTRGAMQAFMASTNASLPVREPEFVMLSMVQNHRGQGCAPLVVAKADIRADTNPDDGTDPPRKATSRKPRETLAQARPDAIAKPRPVVTKEPLNWPAGKSEAVINTEKKAERVTAVGEPSGDTKKLDPALDQPAAAKADQQLASTDATEPAAAPATPATERRRTSVRRSTARRAARASRRSYYSRYAYYSRPRRIYRRTRPIQTLNFYF